MVRFSSELRENTCDHVVRPDDDLGPVSFLSDMCKFELNAERIINTWGTL